MICGPDGIDKSGQPREVGQQNAAAIGWAERRNTIVSARGPWVPQVKTKRASHHMNGSNMRRDANWRGQGPALMMQLIDHGESLSARPKQQMNPPCAQAMRSEPAGQGCTSCDTAEAEPAAHPRKRGIGARIAQRKGDIRRAFAERDEHNPRSIGLKQMIDDDRGIRLQRAKAADID